MPDWVGRAAVEAEPALLGCEPLARLVPGDQAPPRIAERADRDEPKVEGDQGDEEGEVPGEETVLGVRPAEELLGRPGP